MDSSKLISCIIPTYKRSDALVRAINSVLNQSYRELEIIVVDDNNPNDEYSIQVQKSLSSISDERVHYLQQKVHKNGAVARNFGVKNSNGAYIAFLDDDDEWHKDKLKIQIETLEKLDSSYGAVACRTTFFNQDKKINTTSYFNEDSLQKKVLERSVSFNTSTVLFKRDNLIKMGIFNEKLERHQDLQLFVEFLEYYKIKPIDISLVNYHIDDDSNRPTLEKLLKIKKEFFTEINYIVSKYSEKDQKDIIAAHQFEIIHVALKQKKFILALNYVIKIGFNITAYKKVLKRLSEKNKS